MLNARVGLPRISIDGWRSHQKAPFIARLRPLNGRLMSKMYKNSVFLIPRRTWDLIRYAAASSEATRFDSLSSFIVSHRECLGRVQNEFSHRIAFHFSRWCQWKADKKVCTDFSIIHSITNSTSIFISKWCAHKRTLSCRFFPFVLDRCARKEKSSKNLAASKYKLCNIFRLKMFQSHCARRVAFERRCGWKRFAKII